MIGKVDFPKPYTMNPCQKSLIISTYMSGTQTLRHYHVHKSAKPLLATCVQCDGGETVQSIKRHKFQDCQLCHGFAVWLWPDPLPSLELIWTILIWKPP